METILPLSNIQIVVKAKLFTSITEKRINTVRGVCVLRA